MSKMSRAKLRGRKLLDDCYRATVCHGDFMVGDVSVDTCWGLVDPKTDDAWDECRGCRAYCNNVPEQRFWAEYIGAEEI